MRCNFSEKYFQNSTNSPKTDISIVSDAVVAKKGDLENKRAEKLTILTKHAGGLFSLGEPIAGWNTV